MIFFLRSLPRLIRNASMDMKRHVSMTLSSVISISIALLLSMFMIVVALNVDYISSSVESTIQLQVSLSPVLSQDQKNQVQSSILAIDQVSSAVYSSREEELDKLIEENGDMFSQYLKANPLYDVFIVDLQDPQALEEAGQQIEQIDGVAQVDYGGSSIRSLISVFESLRTIGYVCAIALMVLGVFLIRNTIEMTIGLREDEVFIMRTVGAYNFYIMMPFILEGLFMGFSAALIPAVLIGSGYPWMYHALMSARLGELFQMYPPSDFMGGLLAYDFVLGLLLGVLGSWMAVARTIRKVR